MGAFRGVQGLDTCLYISPKSRMISAMYICQGDGRLSEVLELQSLLSVEMRIVRCLASSVRVMY